jgi:hypothetical protein
MVDGVALYVLNPTEEGEFASAVKINEDIYGRLSQLTAANFLNWKDLSSGTFSNRVIGKYHVATYTITGVEALPGKEIKVKEYLNDDETEILGTYLNIDGVDFTVNQPEGDIRATTGRTMLLAQNGANPFL